MSLKPGAAFTFTAVGVKADSTTVAITATWSATGGTVSSGGSYTAGTATGTYRVIATLSGATLADTASVTITAATPTLETVEISPGTVSLAPSTVQQFAAVGHMSDGSTAGVSVTWSATGGGISPAGLFTAGAMAGAFRVIATQQGGTKADTAAVTVASTPPSVTLQAIVVAPGSSSLAAGGTQQFSATGRMSDGSVSTVAVTWSASGGTVSSNGAYTAGSAAGTYRVIATHQSSALADTSTITIAPPPPTVQKVILTPASVTLSASNTQQFTVTGQMTDGSSVSVPVNYTATGGSIGAAGLYTAGASAGSFRVIAVQQGGTLADTAAVTIAATAPTLTAVEIAPGSASLLTGSTQQFSVVGRMSDGSSAAVGAGWVATGGTISSNGLYTAGGTGGSFRVIATQAGGTKADTASITISAPAPTLSAVVVTPATATVAAGATQQFAAVGKMSDNSTQPVTVIWSATGGTISSGGLYTAGATAGTSYQVIALQQGGSKADTASITISAPAPTLSAVVVTPATATVVAGATQQFTAIGRMTDNSSQAVTVTWSATGGTISGGGLYTAGATAGTAYQVIALQQGGAKADTSLVTVAAASPVGHDYSTSFALNENPISEGGRWINGGSVGLDWSNVSTTPGLAIGRQASASYTDATALLNGQWGTNQSVTATVHAVNPKDACYQEVELRLRSTVAAHLNNGYEISFKVSSSSDAYLIIVRWNGPLGNYTYLFNQNGAQYGVKEGDVISAKVVGNQITAYKNGVQMATAVDNTYTGGSPGMGFNLENAPAGCSGTNGDYGFTSFVATDTP